MTTTGFDVRKVGGRLGAEITGVDLAGDLDPAIVSEIHAALLAHKALIFRGQHLDDAAQHRFASLFGEVASAEEPPRRADHWHTAGTVTRTPPAALTLRGSVVPPYGGGALVADTGAAYRDLPLPLRQLADQLWAVHHAGGRPAPGIRPAAHPVVRVHPETGERGLLIGAFARHILGLSADESRDILRIFQSYVTRPENVVRLAWEPGDLIIFDNRLTQHYVPDDHEDLPRLLHRVTVAGDVPAGVDGERSTLVEGDDAVPRIPAAAA